MQKVKVQRVLHIFIRVHYYSDFVEILGSPADSYSHMTLKAFEFFNVVVL